MEDTLSAQSGIFFQESARNCILAVATRSYGALQRKCKPQQTEKNTVRKEASIDFA
jgi:hypothetical protein